MLCVDFNARSSNSKDYIDDFTLDKFFNTKTLMLLTPIVLDVIIKIVKLTTMVTKLLTYVYLLT